MSPARNMRSLTGVKASSSDEKICSQQRSTRHSKSQSPSPSRNTRSSTGMKSSTSSDKMFSEEEGSPSSKSTTLSPGKSTHSVRGIKTSNSSSGVKMEVKLTKIASTAGKSCRQIHFTKENISVADGSPEQDERGKPTGISGTKEKIPMRKRLHTKESVELKTENPKQITHNASPKKGRKSPSKRANNTTNPEARVTRGRSKALASLITQVEDRLKTVAPVPDNLQIDADPVDQSESFFSGRSSSSEESGSSDDQNDDEEEDLNLRISDDDDMDSPSKRSSLKKSTENVSPVSTDVKIVLTRVQGTSPIACTSQNQGLLVDVPFKTYTGRKSPDGTKKSITVSIVEMDSKQGDKESTDVKTTGESASELQLTKSPKENVVTKNEPKSGDGSELSVFESSVEDDPTSAFTSNILDEYLVKHRDINQTLKNDPAVFKPLSPPTKYTASHVPRMSPQKQINIKPDVDEIEGINVFSYFSAKELDVHVSREKAIISEWNYEPADEKPVGFHQVDTFSAGKTEDFTQIKGWQNKIGIGKNKQSANMVPKLKCYAARGLIRKLRPEEVENLGLHLKSRRRRSPVLLHRKSDNPEATETRTNSNIYGRKRDGRFATKRSVWPKKCKGK